MRLPNGTMSSGARWRPPPSERRPRRP
uniref:Uncharacterized protein n=1 Tax=Arundo donax TaxID=35708 RepID=A0A0A9BEJ0_ARUDO